MQITREEAHRNITAVLERSLTKYFRVEEIIDSMASDLRASQSTLLADLDCQKLAAEVLVASALGYFRGRFGERFSVSKAELDLMIQDKTEDEAEIPA